VKTDTPTDHGNLKTIFEWELFGVGVDEGQTTIRLRHAYGELGQVGAESIVQRDPEVIVLTDADLPFNPQTPEMVAARPGWGAITAVKNGAVHVVPGALYSTPGPRLAQGLEDLARLLHPDRFPAAGQ
jgi:ABC-type Fe3+-hydroxamate transport system substrate-binding protein